MNTETWLGSSDNSCTREQLFLHQLCYDLTLAAARRQTTLALLTVDVDRYGWDLALDDGDNEIRLQLKTVHTNASTKGWPVKKRLLRPALGLQKALGFDPGPEGEGLGGGFLLIEWNLNINETITVKYHYASAFTLVALDRGITGTSAQQKQATTVLANLRTGSGTEELTLTNLPLVTVKSPDALLAIMGLHSTNGPVTWNLLWRERPEDEPASVANTSLKEELNQLLE